MPKALWALAFFCVVLALPLRAFDWETATARGREYVTLRSFCEFYGFTYQAPSGNDRFVSRNTAGHAVSMKIGSPDLYVDGVHYVMSFPVEGGDRDWLVSRMDVIKLFEPVLRPSEISGRHAIRGVVIDAGHGGSDNGAQSHLGAEKNYTLDTAGRLSHILNDAGLKTVFTRRSDVFVDLYERAHIASLYPDYCFVSLHFNSASEEARGLETYCVSPRGAASTSSSYLTRGDLQKLPGNDDDLLNIVLASLVHSEIIKLNPGDATADRGVKRARFVVIKQNVLPAILVEGGFVSNHMEAARVNRPDYRQSLAQAIARGVIRFVNVMGDRALPLPNSAPGGEETPAAPMAPAAPSGLAHDPANGNLRAIPVGPTSAQNPPVAAATTHKSKHGKKGTAASATPKVPPVVAQTPTPAPVHPRAISSASSKGNAPLNLREPDAEPISAEADKAPPEPDEPPTGNTPPPRSPSTNAAPANPSREP